MTKIRRAILIGVTIVLVVEMSAYLAISGVMDSLET